MSDPFLGEVQIFGFPFAPINWALANGALIPLRQSTALFALLGANFGGNGTTTFGLPNLASRQACGAGQSPGNSMRSMGQTFGTPSVSLQIGEMPMHNHILNAYATEDGSQLVDTPTVQTAIGNSLDGLSPYGAADSGSTTMNLNAIGVSGTGAAHENCQPFLGLTYAIALEGVFPAFN